MEFMILQDHEELFKTPFLFDKSVIEDGGYEDFLRKLGVFNLGFWRFKLPLPSISELNKAFKDNEALTEGYVLPIETILMSIPPSIAAQPKNWYQYFSWRDLPLTSPAAALLHWPLTLYHILSNVLDFRNDPSFKNGLDSGCLTVHFIGVEIELHALPVFLELQNLIPDVRLNLVFMGPQIPASLNNWTWSSGHLRLILRRGTAHELWSTDSQPRPHLVVGFNAGLGVFQAWQNTVRAIEENHLEAVFTDYCRYSADHSIALVNSRYENRLQTSPVTINPFRSPFRVSNDNDGETPPCYSNAVIYRLRFQPQLPSLGSLEMDLAATYIQ